MNESTFDFLGFLADDRFGITYKPRWNAVTGSITASVLLQQMIFRWAHAGRRPFYKFARPCAHRLYRAGDSWEEELGMKRREFESARDALATRTRGDIAPDALVSYWVDAQRVTWYAINEAILLERFSAVYPKSDAGIQLPLPAAESAAPPALMDETYIRSNGRNVHQANGQLMDETSISYDVPNVHQLMHETSITTDAPNVHPLYSQNEITQQRSPQTSTAAPTAADPPPAAAAVDPLQTILDWIGFDDTLKDTERRRLDLATLLAWAYTVKLKEALPRARGRVYNPVGLARSLWRHGQPPRADLLRLARGWLALSDDGRARLLGRLEWGSDYGGQLDTYDFQADFPDIPPLAAQAVYTATGGQLAPHALSPAAIEPVCPTDRPTPAAQSTDDTPRSVPQTTPSTPATLWREALAELEMQMTRATFDQNLRNTTATLTGDTLTVHVRNHHAVDWLSNRLHDLITRTAASVAGRPLLIRYEAADPTPEAHHG